jgi:thiol-disulfide isomerase/thioredoxin
MVDMKIFLLLWTIFIVLLLSAFVTRFNNEHETLKIGSAAPDFSLKGVDEKIYNLNSFKDARVLVIVFTCNHCPTAQAYEDRIIQLTADYANKNVAVVAIMPNDPASLRLDELDFSDLGDSYAEMKIRAKEKKFNFPYLYDGETETASRAYGPIATPHIFVFDRERKLRYEGRIDDMENPFRTPNSTDARNAIEALLNDREVAVKTTKVFGCSVKWSEKKDLVEKSRQAWAKEPVHLDLISEDSVKNMMKNPSGKLRLINIWSMGSEASKKEFPEFITINRMYRDRDFVFISVSVDEPGNQGKVLQFLSLQQASNSNYLFSTNDKEKMLRAIDPSWQGDLPYTLLVEPGGKVVYTKVGAIDPATLKSTIVNNHLLGRFP